MLGLIRWACGLAANQWRRIDDDYAKDSAADSGAGDSAGSSGKSAARTGGKERNAGKRKRKARSAPDKSASTEALAPDNKGDGAKGDGAAPAAARDGSEWMPLVVLVTVAISLSLQEYYGQRWFYRKLVPPNIADPYWQLKEFVWWSGWRFFGYVVIPAITILAMPGERLRDYYIMGKGFLRHLWIYAVLFALILPAVIIAAQSKSFYLTYPFYKYANRSAADFWAWEALYALQFVSLEFFFRGYMLHGLRRIGSKAIFVMIVPYCMIHFGKPLLETIGAIGAGLILGTLAMRTRSIWGGIVIHVGVALTMDWLALSHCPPPESGQPCSGRR